MITITVYLGTKEWDGPRKLSDMFGDVDEELLPFIPDYRINLLAPREITDFTGFRTSIRQMTTITLISYMSVMKSPTTYRLTTSGHSSTTI